MDTFFAVVIEDSTSSKHGSMIADTKSSLRYKNMSFEDFKNATMAICWEHYKVVQVNEDRSHTTLFQR